MNSVQIPILTLQPHRGLGDDEVQRIVESAIEDRGDRHKSSGLDTERTTDSALGTEITRRHTDKLPDWPSLKVLGGRALEIVTRYYGFGCHPRHTLERVNAHAGLGITRERVRQLKRDALSRLHDPQTLQLGHVVIITSERVGLLVKDDEFSHALSRIYPELSDPDSGAYARLLLDVVGREQSAKPELRGIDLWLSHELARHHGPTSLVSIEDALMDDEHWSEKLSAWPEFDLRLRLTHLVGAEELGDGYYVATPVSDAKLRGPQRRFATIERILRTAGQPLHAQVIRDRVNSELPESLRFGTVSNLAIRLSTHTDRFRWAGNSTYGLSEWESLGIRDQSRREGHRIGIGDEIVTYLRELRTPIQLSAIRDYIEARFKVRRGTVKSAVGNGDTEDRFIHFGDGRIGLREHYPNGLSENDLLTVCVKCSQALPIGRTRGMCQECRRVNWATKARARYRRGESVPPQCAHCDSPTLVGQPICSDHLTKHGAAMVKKYRKELRLVYGSVAKTNLCPTCSQPSGNGKRCCETHSTSNREGLQRKYEQRRESGLCVQCGHPSVEGKAMCADHAGSATAKSRTKAAKRRAAGLCVQCGIPTVDGRSLCQQHIQRRNALRQLRRAERMARGQCRECDRIPELGRTRCSLHRSGPRLRTSSRSSVSIPENQ